MADEDPPVTPATPVAPVSSLPRYTVMTAAIIVGMYLVLTLIMIFSLGAKPDEEPHWQHALLIYNGFMAFATSAAGVLLGTQIQQANVAASQQMAGQAAASEQKVKSAVKDALDKLDGKFTEAGGGVAGPDMAKVQEAARTLRQAL